LERDLQKGHCKELCFQILGRRLVSTRDQEGPRVSPQDSQHEEIILLSHHPALQQCGTFRSCVWGWPCSFMGGQGPLVGRNLALSRVFF
jgi:hypothetical protein